MKISRLVWLPLLVCMSLVHADDMTKLKAELKKQLPEMELQSLSPVGESGLYEAIIDDRIYYFTADGKYLVQGDLLSLESRENITETRRIEVKKGLLDKLNEDDLIVFAAKKPVYTVTVFTDIDCGYCRELHRQIKDYNNLGITVRYMAYPRAGAESESANKLIEVWCAKDPQKAMTDAKAQREVKKTSLCENNPVAEQFEIGGKLGVRGTPAIFLEDGQMLPGYVPPEKLREILDEYLGSS
ncbi:MULTISPECIES: thioredoxin fold domain-containing protein [unclassified Methylophaga]|uniref:thioredoxin fold domain-containing protein n=1 Tax=unclassified Methylophaga TaxID=2629249 RepID=UPI000C8C64B5|nr:MULTISPECIES: thioredoxin fold domain-containing protein [unclassified Methylophaga]MBN45458.1 disulfide bond formation protein DsbC [Methylophaga sp.]